MTLDFPATPGAQDISTRRPSVHLLCAGVYLQKPMQLSSGELVFPLPTIGFRGQIDSLVKYSLAMGARVDPVAINTLQQRTENAFPSVSLIHPLSVWESADQAYSSVADRLNWLCDMVSWATGNHVQPYGVLILGPQDHETYFRVVPPEVISRIRLNFSGSCIATADSLSKIVECAVADEHFALALSILHDANAANNNRFKIARYFLCLEALAYRLKTHGVGSRDAVRQLLGLSRGRTGQCNVGGRSYTYDVVLGAGILRDQLFHGGRQDYSKENKSEKDTFDLLQSHPEIFVQDLQGRVELEISRWVNGTSNGLA